MTAHGFIGHCSMFIKPAAGMFALLCSVSALAEEFPADAQELDAESALQLEERDAPSDFRLDPAVFTELSPVTATEVAIKLPEDQHEDG